MNPAQQSLVDEVRSRFGERIALTDAVDIEPWLTDWRGRWTGKAAAVLQPSSTGEVAAIVETAARLGVALVPQGGNTSMVGGATPSTDGAALILSLRRMNRIRAIDPLTGTGVGRPTGMNRPFGGSGARPEYGARTRTSWPDRVSQWSRCAMCEVTPPG